MKHNLHILIACLATLLLPAASMAQESGEENRYQECMELSSSKPAEALNIALLWKEKAGGAPARHCEAVS